MFWNMNKAYIQSNIRKAPKMELEDFKKFVETVIPHSLDKYDSQLDIIGDIDYDSIIRFGLVDYPDTLKYTAKIRSDLAMINIGFKHTRVIDIRQSNSGVPYIVVECNNDDERPMAILIYWDSESFRSYIPVYGNTLNLKTKSPLSIKSLSSGSYYITDYNGYNKELRFNTNEDFRVFLKKYIDSIEINYEAIHEDFSSAIRQNDDVSNNYDEFSELINHMVITKIVTLRYIIGNNYKDYESRKKEFDKKLANSYNTPVAEKQQIVNEMKDKGVSNVKSKYNVANPNYIIIEAYLTYRLPTVTIAKYNGEKVYDQDISDQEMGLFKSVFKKFAVRKLRKDELNTIVCIDKTDKFKIDFSNDTKKSIEEYVDKLINEYSTPDIRLCYSKELIKIITEDDD